MKTIVGILLALLACPVLQRGAIASAPAPENAASYYRQAFEALPQGNAEQEAYEKWGEIVFDTSAVGLIKRLEPSMALLHSGSAAGQIDWGWNYGKGLALKMPEVNKSRDLSRAAALSIRYMLEQKQYKAAARRAVDVMVLGRRLQLGRAIVTWLVGYGVELEGNIPISAYLPKIPPEELRELEAALDSLPEAQPLADAIAGEKEMCLRSIRNAGLVKGDPVATEVPNDPSQRVQLVKEFRRLWDQAAKVAAMPPEQAGQAAAAFKQQLEAASPAAQKIVLNKPETLAFRAAKAVEDRLLFRAAVAVAQSGPAALKNFRDPYGDGPFTYAKLPDGFELRCKLMDHGQPVTLTVGPAALR